MRIPRIKSISAITRAMLLVLATIGIGLTGASSAFAASSAETCATPTSTGDFRVVGTLNDGAKPLANVKVLVTGNGFSGCGTSGTDGKFVVIAPAAGDYIATIDTSTLPKGVIIDKAANSQKVNLVTTNVASVLFAIGEAQNSAPSIWSQLAIFSFQGLDFGLMLALCAIGLSLIFGTTGFSNFAHGETVTSGALVAWFLSSVLSWPILLAAVATIFVIAGYGWLQNKLIWAPLRRRRLGSNQTMIVSIGFAMAMRYFLMIVFGADTKDFSGNLKPVTFGPIHTTNIALISIAVSIVVLGGIAWFLTRTRIGKATRAVSDNPALALATGIDNEKIITYIWVLGGLTTGIAGILFGLQYQANWYTGASLLLLMFAATTLGGLGTALGTAIGALIIGMVVQVAAIAIPTDLTFATAMVVLMLTLLVRPQGIMGKKQRLG